MSRLLLPLLLLCGSCGHEPLTWVGPNGEPFDLAVYESVQERAGERARRAYRLTLDESIRIEMNNLGWRRAALPDFPVPPQGYVWRLAVPAEVKP